MRFSLRKRGQTNGGAPLQPEQRQHRPYERPHPFSEAALRLVRRFQPVDRHMSQAEIEMTYWQRQAERQRQQAETEIALVRAAAETKAGIEPGTESSVPWQRWRSERGSSNFLDREF